MGEGMLTRRSFLKVTGGAGLGLLWPGVNWSATPRRLSLRYAYSAFSVPAVLWPTNNFARRYGLEDITFLPTSGGREVNDMLLGGQADVGDGGVGPIITLGSLVQERLHILMVHYHGDVYGTLVKPSSPYKSIEELRGKKIGMLIGSGSYVAFLLMLSAEGMKEKDFEIVNIKPADLPAALESGLVDAAHIWEPNATMIEVRGIGRTVKRYKKYVQNPTPLWTLSEIVEKKRDELVRFVAGQLDAQEFVKNNVREAARVSVEAFARRGVQVPAKAFEIVLGQYYVYEPEMPAEALESIHAQAKIVYRLEKLRRLPKFTINKEILAAAQELRRKVRGG